MRQLPPPSLNAAVSAFRDMTAEPAEGAGAHQAVDVAERRHEVKVLGDHQHAPGVARRRDHAIGLLDRRRDRLLDEHVEARAERREGVGTVPVVRRADQQDVPDARQHEHRERVIDHRLVVDGQQLFRYRTRDRV